MIVTAELKYKGQFLVEKYREPSLVRNKRSGGSNPLKFVF